MKLWTSTSYRYRKEMQPAGAEMGGLCNVSSSTVSVMTASSMHGQILAYIL